MRSLVVGLGRAGAGLHPPVLAKLRGSTHGLIVAPTIDEAAARLGPSRAVAHVRTPPTEHSPILSEFAELGFRKLIVERPLATDIDDLARLIGLRRKYKPHVRAVEPWLASAVTRRLAGLIRGGWFGPPRTTDVVQREPRFRRSLMSGAVEFEKGSAIGHFPLSVAKNISAEPVKTYAE
ncbi:hypothetical protein SD37_30535 [Amycolatopsis orientalis]|uniref:Gfo/Idh/MocA-like oxidoreductase N-terminal domain-containing protein n=1 Tax=Amycolatopsis orientalis TaxID=31958 RepID=A0A193C4P5_AMYOR|nr:hypothetical protein [Amycolatopsis orientalis]ANN19531.1 hypothetical protein SD37_30535 [Amycolatopsis orientalis]